MYFIYIISDLDCKRLLNLNIYKINTKKEFQSYKTRFKSNSNLNVRVPVNIPVSVNAVTIEFIVIWIRLRHNQVPNEIPEM